ncbi:MAG: HEPN domain-containing protein [Vulcanisaeta sp.]|uniref:HEPN domain-containing protein n=1 Tax=Vulcanisaeta sp. TaxID=2020871 RepID=UPI003D09C30E
MGAGFYPETCFFAQQAVEFYLKGKLIELTGSRLYTYSIIALLNQVVSILNKPLSNDIIKCAKLLTATLKSCFFRFRILRILSCISFFLLVSLVSPRCPRRCRRILRLVFS